MSARLAVVLPIVAGIFLGAPLNVQAQRRPAPKEGADKAPSLVVDSAVLASSAHGKLVCVACHTSLDPGNIPYPGRIEQVNCVRCHANAQFKHAFHPELAAAIRSSGAPRVSCKDCHGTHDIASPKAPGSKFQASRLSASCGECHRKALETFRSSAHGAALAASVKGAPTCLACHRQRITFAGATSDSLSGKTAQAQACLSCHADNPAVREATSSTAGFIVSWANSPHGRALQHGDARAASCVNCHGSHGISKTRDSASLVSGANLASTCAACHATNVQKFRLSAHGVALSKGDTAAPACTTCHGEHPKPAARASSVGGASAVPSQVCSHCHEPALLQGKYGIASDQFKSSSDSYHGFGARGGSVEVSNCASCHDPHDVKPPNDPTSGVSKANRPVTCGKCHKGTSERLFSGPVHVKISTHKNLSR